MTQVPPEDRTGPQSLDEIGLGTLYALRNAAVAHGQALAADQFAAEIQRREKGAGKRR